MNTPRLIFAPTVELVARSVPDEVAIERWLGDTEWTAGGTGTPAERIVEGAARNCFDDKTELLTPWGWKPVAEVGVDEPVATLNPDENRFEFQLVDVVHRPHFKGHMLEYEGRDVSFCVTPNHRQFAAARRGKQYAAEFSFGETEALLRLGAFKVKTAGGVCGGSVPHEIAMPRQQYEQSIGNQTGSGLGVAVKITKPVVASGQERVIALAHLSAHYVSNGSIRRTKRGGAGIVVYGRESAEIERLCGVLGLPASVRVDARNGCPRTYIGGGITLASYFEWACGRGFAHKKLPGWVLSLPAEHLEAVWQILVRTDGYRSARGRERFDTGSEHMVGQAAEILAKLGHSSSVSLHRGTKNPCWSVRKKDGRDAVIEAARVRRVPHDGPVYCVSTRNGIVYTRRNGKVHYSGNCYWSYGAGRDTPAYFANILDHEHYSVLEHASFTFAIRGVSRSLTHELVRHRHTSPSQLSQRYCDQTDKSIGLGLVVPVVMLPLHDEWTELFYRWHNSCLESVDHYVSLCCHLAALGHDRKSAHDAARSLLPEACETRLWLSGNARAWLEAIPKRISPAAAPEIRRLFAAILALLAPEMPHVFGRSADGTHANGHGDGGQP